MSVLAANKSGYGNCRYATGPLSIRQQSAAPPTLRILTMNASNLVLVLKTAAAAVAANIALVMVLAWPFGRLWNLAVVPMASSPRLGYAESAAILGVTWMIGCVARGITAWVKIERSPSPVLRQFGF